MTGFDIIINKNAGAVLNAGEQSIRDDLENALGYENIKAIRFVQPAKLQQAFEDIDDNDKVLVGGGDGTLVSAASILNDKKIAFGLLPFGTMNLLCKDLNIPEKYAEAAAAYKIHDTISIDVGTVNGHIFLCAAMIGMFEALAEQREKQRDSGGFMDWISFAGEAIDKFTNDAKHSFDIHYPTHTEKKTVKSVVISNNTYLDFAKQPLGAFKKKSLQDGEFGVYSIETEGALESVQLLSSLIAGNWQNDPGVDVSIAHTLTIDNGDKEIPVLLDGEKFDLKAPLEFKMVRKSLRVLVPVAEAS